MRERFTLVGIGPIYGSTSALVRFSASGVTLSVYSTSKGIVGYYRGRVITTEPALRDMYYSALAYVQMTGSVEGFPVYELDLSN